MKIAIDGFILFSGFVRRSPYCLPLAKMPFVVEEAKLNLVSVTKCIQMSWPLQILLAAFRHDDVLLLWVQDGSSSSYKMPDKSL